MEIHPGDTLRVVKPLVGYKSVYHTSNSDYLTTPVTLAVGTLLKVKCYDRVTDDGLAYTEDGKVEVDITSMDLRLVKE